MDEVVGVDKFDVGNGEFCFDLPDGAVEVNGTACVANDDSFKTESASVESGVAHTVVVGESAEEDAREAAFAQVAGQTGGGGAIVLEECRVGVDLRAKAFAQDEFGAGQLQGGVELRSCASLNAVVWPEGLRAVGHFDGLVGLLAGLGAGEGSVVGRMPVLGEDDVLKARRDLQDGRDDGIAIMHSESPTGAEVVLHVDDEECGLWGGMHGAVHLGL